MTNIHLNNKSKWTNPSYRSPAHPSFQEKRHSLIIDAQNASNRKVKTESGTLKFENGVAVLPADERAGDIVDELNETEALHPQQYSLTRKRTVNIDEIHRYHFGSHPAMPWHKYDEQV